MKVIVQKTFEFAVYKGPETVSLTSCFQTGLRVCVYVWGVGGSMPLPSGPAPVILLSEASR